MRPPQALQSEPMRSFEAERRRHLIEATIETVAQVGFKSASLGEIARRADVSQGLFAHYFGDKDGLLEATLRFMAARLTRATAARMRAAKTPLERVLAVPESALAPEEFDARTSAVWLAFWGQIMHSKAYRRVQWIYQNRMRSNLKHGLRDLVAPERVEICAAFIAATIDGLWLQSHADRKRRSDGAEVRATVRALVQTLIGADGVCVPADFRAGHDRIAPARPAPAARMPVLDPVWAHARDEARRDVLLGAAAAVKTERRKLALMEAKDTGRPVAEIETHDLPLVARLFERAGSLAAPRAERLSYDGDVARLDRRPAGVVEVHAHWSAPLLLGARIAAPALAAGATVMLRASAPKTRALARLRDILREAGLPEGAVGLVAGEDAMPFEPAGPADWRDGPPKSAVIVSEGADPKAVAAALIRGPRAFARARALSETIVFAAPAIHGALVERLRAEVAALTLGDPTESETEIGPLRSRMLLETALCLIEEARQTGATLRCGGRAVESEGRGRGAMMKPALLDRCRPAMAVARTKLFAPIVMVCGFETDAELVGSLAEIGPNLSLGWFGGDVGRARAVSRAAGACVCRIDGAGAALSSMVEDWAAPRSFGTVARLFAPDDERA